MGILMGLLAMTFWGVALFLAAIASRKIGNIATLFWMQACGFIVAFIYFFFTLRSFSFSATIKFAPLLLIIAILQVIAYLSFYKGVEKGQVVLVSPLASAWGLISALLSIIFFKEALKVNQLVAMVLIIVGILAISFNPKKMLLEKGFRILEGAKEGIVAMLGWGVSLFLLIFATKELGWFLPAFIFRFFILLLLFIYAFLSAKKSLLPKSERFPWLLLLLIGIFDVSAFFAYSLGVLNAYGSIVAPVGSAYALVTIVLGILFLKERVQPRQMVGIGAIIAGLIMLSL